MVDKRRWKQKEKGSIFVVKSSLCSGRSGEIRIIQSLFSVVSLCVKKCCTVRNLEREVVLLCTLMTYGDIVFAVGIAVKCGHTGNHLWRVWLRVVYVHREFRRELGRKEYSSLKIYKGDILQFLGTLTLL